jgi:DNA-binding response OmpR family regulator
MTHGEEGPRTSVLIVDDEPQLLRALAVNLRARGYAVHQAVDGNQALRTAADARPDAVILDLGLPDLDGVEVVRGLRGWSQMPIIEIVSVLASSEHEDEAGERVAVLRVATIDPKQVVESLRAAEYRILWPPVEPEQRPA